MFVKALVVLLMTTSLVPAQWIRYPTVGIPRMPDGKPNMTAPAPKTPDGKPDLTGLWYKERDPHFNDLAMDVEHVPFLPWAEEAFKKAHHSKDEWQDGVACLPRGFPRQAMAGTHPFRILQTPGMTVMMMEEFTNYRQVFTDGRPLPPADSQPTFFGYSVGRWDGSTFVVDTIGINENEALDNVGHPHTDALHLIERYRRPDFGHLELELTVDDPKAYSAPWKANIEFNFYADTELMEHTCENEKSAKHLPVK